MLFELLRSDVVLLDPAEECASLIRYRPERYPFPICQLDDCVQEDDIRYSASIANVPVYRAPALVCRSYWGQKYGGAYRLGWFRGAAAALGLAFRENPERYRDAWRIDNSREDISQLLLRRWMFIAVPKATFVVTGEGGFAAAVRYSPGTDEAPLALAVGSGRTGNMIRALAEEHGLDLESGGDEEPVLRRALKPFQFIGEPYYASIINVISRVGGRWPYSLDDKSGTVTPSK